MALSAHTETHVPRRPPGSGEGGELSFDLERPWSVHRQVALRPEAFGALAYHFGTRRLSFLKTRKLLAVVQSLAEHPTGREACRAAGVSDPEMPSYARALERLRDSGMLVERSPS